MGLVAEMRVDGGDRGGLMRVLVIVRCVVFIKGVPTVTGRIDVPRIVNCLGRCQPAAASAVNALGMILTSMLTMVKLIVISLRLVLLMVVLEVVGLVVSLCVAMLLLGPRLLVQPCVDGTVVDAFRRQDGLPRFGSSKGILHHSSCAGVGAVGCHASAIDSKFWVFPIIVAPLFC